MLFCMDLAAKALDAPLDVRPAPCTPATDGGGREANEHDDGDNRRNDCRVKFPVFHKKPADPVKAAFEELRVHAW